MRKWINVEKNRIELKKRKTQRKRAQKVISNKQIERNQRRKTIKKAKTGCVE